MANTNALRRAIKAGDTKQVEALLLEGLDVNAPLKKGWAALHLAAKSGQEGVIAILLERGANVDAQTELRQTALDVALASKQVRAAKLLKSRGGRKGAERTLHAAVVAGDTKWVRKHLRAGADINRVDSGELPLCLAFARHQWDVARLLLKRHPNVNKRQTDRSTALHEAAHAGADEGLLKAILALGADINAVGGGGMSALCWAAAAGHEETVEFLIRSGADVGYQSRDGTGPVSEAVHENHYDLARLLIDHGARSSLFHAVRCDHLAKARQLLSEGADVQERDDWCLDCPMSVAIWNDSIEMVQLLLEFGASPNEQEPIRQSASGAFGGNTPLHDAVRTGSVKLVKLLLSRGADPDIQDAQGLSPLELAKRRDQTHLVRLMETQIDRTILGENVDRLYTIGKVAELLSVEESFVQGLLKQGKLTQVRLDASTIRVPASSLRRYISKLVK